MGSQDGSRKWWTTMVIVGKSPKDRVGLVINGRTSWLIHGGDPNHLITSPGMILQVGSFINNWGVLIRLIIKGIYWELPPTCNSPKRRLLGGPYWTERYIPSQGFSHHFPYEPFIRSSKIESPHHSCVLIARWPVCHWCYLFPVMAFFAKVKGWRDIIL